MDLPQFLDTLDINSYEKRAIAFLAEIDSADARTVCRRANIPQGRIYSVMGSLAEKGLIETIPTSPKRYSVDDVKSRLGNYLEMKKSEIERRSGHLQELDTPPRMFRMDRKDPSVRLFTGRAEHISANIYMRDSAKRSLRQISPLFIGTFASHLALEKALRRGVEIRVIVKGVSARNRKNIKRCVESGGQVRKLDSQDMTNLLIKDGEEFLLGVHDYRNEERRMVLLSRNRGLLKALEAMFDSAWRKSKPISKKSLD